MNYLISPVLFLFFIFIVVVSCNRVKTASEVTVKYADGKAKKVDEYLVDDKGNYITNEKGNKVLYKETYYFPGEKKYVSGTYNKTQERNGVWTSWYDNGQKNSEQNYIDGKEDGIYSVWHPNGKPYIKGEYKMGEKIGIWSFHDTLGNVIKEHDFGKK
jgi:antitoxin component YwqK of YwqJK toxin-antitoxin module